MTDFERKKSVQIRRYQLPKLPSEMWGYIFSQPDLLFEDKVRLRMVCQHFKAIVESTAWPKEIRAFSNNRFGREPWKLNEKLTRAVTLTELISLIPYAQIVIVLKVDNTDANLLIEDVLDLLQYFPGLISLDIRRSKITNLDQLQNVKNLRSLNLSRCSNLKDISVLSELSKLKYLYLMECSSLEDISVLSALTKLTELHIEGCRRLRKDSIDYLQELLPKLKIYR